jgi:hypothetical protein
MRRLSSKTCSESVSCFAQIANRKKSFADGAALPIAIRLPFLFLEVGNAADCLIHGATAGFHPVLDLAENWMVCLLDQRSLLVFLAVYFVWRNDHRGGYLVVGFQIQQAHALCVTSGGANGVGIDADDFAPLADHHQL